jgi:transcriptional regulator with XRE-family HTH domain
MAKDRKQRLIELRHRAGLSQRELADKIEQPFGTYSGWENNNGRRIPHAALDAMARILNTTVKYIEEGEVDNADVNKRSFYNMPPRQIVVDSTGKEKILFVPVKAQAGYRKHIADPLFLKDLRAYSLPGFENGTYRIFEVEGDSMIHPDNTRDSIHPGDYVIASHVEALDEIKDGEIYVIVTTDGVCLKRCYNHVERRGLVVIESNNPEYKPDAIPAAEILEMWRYVKKIS